MMNKVVKINDIGGIFRVVCSHPDWSSETYFFAIPANINIPTFDDEELEKFNFAVIKNIINEVNPYHIWQEVEIWQEMTIAGEFFKSKIYG